MDGGLMINVEHCLAGLCASYCRDCIEGQAPLPDWCGLRGGISGECNDGHHYECGGCGCWCHRPARFEPRPEVAAVRWEAG